MHRRLSKRMICHSNYSPPAAKKSKDLLRRGKSKEMDLGVSLLLLSITVVLASGVGVLREIEKQLRRANNIQERNQKQQHEKD
jgi:hypothetical protein